MSGAGEGAATPLCPPSPPSCPSPGPPGAGSPRGPPRRSRSCGSCTGSTRRWKVPGVSGVSVGPSGVAGAVSLHPPCPLGGDIIAAILAHLPTAGRTRRQVVKQLVRMGLASSAKDFPRERLVWDPRGQGRDPRGQGRDPRLFPTPRKGTRIVLWTQEQEEELTRLFEEFQGSDGELDTAGRPLETPLQPSHPHPPPHRRPGEHHEAPDGAALAGSGGGEAAGAGAGS